MTRIVCLCIYLLTGAFLFVSSFYTIPSKPEKQWGHDDPVRNAHDDSNYVIIIDAGSSGSRLFIYRCSVPQSGGLPVVQPLRDGTGRNVVKKTEPGLSSFAENPDDAVDYIRDLLDFASSYIPFKKRKETSLFILATAGMRLLPERKQNVIVQALYNRLPSLYDFTMTKGNFEVISGKQEGLYAWITTNYVLGRFGPKSGHQKTAGIIDLGGGSVQIAFEAPHSLPHEQKFKESLFEDVDLSYDGSSSLYKYRVYISTFLGYGANHADKLYEKWLSEQSLLWNSSGNNGQVTISDCCLPKGLMLNFSTSGQRNFKREGAGCFLTCLHDLKRIITANVSCEVPRCSIRGVYQPEIDYHGMEFYGMSEYWYTSNDVFSLGTSYSRDKFLHSSSEYCSTDWSVIWHRFKRKLYPRADEGRLRTQCFKAAWASVLLHTGFGFPEDASQFHPVFQIGGKEIQWTLGAVLHRMRHLSFTHHPQDHAARPRYHPRRWHLWHSWISQCLFVLCVVVALFPFYYRFIRRRCLKGFVILSKKPPKSFPRNWSMYSYMMIDIPEK